MVLSGAIAEWAPLLWRLDYRLVPVCKALATGKASYAFVVIFGKVARKWWSWVRKQKSHAAQRSTLIANTHHQNTSDAANGTFKDSFFSKHMSFKRVNLAGGSGNFSNENMRDVTVGT